MNEQELSDLLDFAKEFSITKENEKQKLPFHLNLIDQLHINENAHSRILMHLLRYQDKERKYVFLSSLIELICKKKQKEGFRFVLESIQNPSFTHDKENIDLWVRDENYAIIFENKVYNAVDQEAQLCRYIDKTNKRYKLENIFVIYLPKYDKEPDRQSWGNFEESFRPRYAKLSYYYDILPWLKDNVRPRIEDKELFLQTAIIQYIDYLEGLFKKREIDKTMNMELNKLIEQHFKLTDKSAKDKIQTIQKSAQEMDDLSSQMKALLESYRKNIYETWKEKTAEKYPELHPNKKSEDAKGWPITDVTFDDIDGKPAVVSIGCDGTQFYSGFYFDFILPNQDRELQGSTVERLKKHLPESNKRNEMFESFGIDQFDEVYQHFENTIAIVKNNDN